MHRRSLEPRHVLLVPDWSCEATRTLTPVDLSSGRFLYRGDTTMTRCPLAASAGGRDPHTSPKPPVLEYGAACTGMLRGLFPKTACCGARGMCSLHMLGWSCIPLPSSLTAALGNVMQVCCSRACHLACTSGMGGHRVFAACILGQAGQRQVCKLSLLWQTAVYMARWLASTSSPAVCRLAMGQDLRSDEYDVELCFCFARNGCSCAGVNLGCFRLDGGCLSSAGLLLSSMVSGRAPPLLVGGFLALQHSSP